MKHIETRQTETMHVIEFTDSELRALFKWVGKTSISDLETLGLTKEEIRLLDMPFYSALRAILREAP